MFITATATGAKVQDGRQAQAEWSGTRAQSQNRQNQEDEKRETGKTQELIQKPLVDLTKKTNWQPTNREHRYKYTGDNGEAGRHLEGDGDNHKDR